MNMLDIFDNLEGIYTVTDPTIDKHRYLDGDLLTEDEMVGTIKSLEMIMSTISEQFKYPDEYYKQDFVADYFDWRSYKRKTAISDEDFEEIDQKDEYFKGFLITRLSDYFGIGFPTISDSSEEEQDLMLHMTYRYFLIHIKRNMKAFIKNAMNQLEETLISNFQNTQLNDVISESHPYLNETGVILLHHVYEIGNYLISYGRDLSIEEFLQLTMSQKLKNQTEISVMEQGYRDCDMVGNFVIPYLRLLETYRDSYINSLISQEIREKYRQ